MSRIDNPTLWSEFHSHLIVELSNALIPSLRPKYYVGVETRTYTDEGEEELLVGIPDALILPLAEQQENLRLSEVSDVAVQTRPTQIRLSVFPSKQVQASLSVIDVSRFAIKFSAEKFLHLH